jgi:hypothetical protein
LEQISAIYLWSLSPWAFPSVECFCQAIAFEFLDFKVRARRYAFFTSFGVQTTDSLQRSLIRCARREMGTCTFEFVCKTPHQAEMCSHLYNLSLTGYIHLYQDLGSWEKLEFRYAPNLLLKMNKPLTVEMKNAWLSLQNDMELMWLFLLLHRQISNVSRQGPELWC